MTEGDEVHYTTSEIRSYLPTGWRLAPGETEGHWDPALRIWTVSVHDGSDLEWPVSVGSDQARSMGRLEALRRSLEILKLGGKARARLRIR